MELTIIAHETKRKALVSLYIQTSSNVYSGMNRKNYVFVTYEVVYIHFMTIPELN